MQLLGHSLKGKVGASTFSPPWLASRRDGEKQMLMMVEQQERRSLADHKVAILAWSTFLDSCVDRKVLLKASDSRVTWIPHCL